MRKLFTVLFFSLLVSSIHAGSGIWEYYVNTSLDGVVSNYGNYSSGTSFNGASLGTVADASTQTLTISLTGCKTFQNSGDWVSGARMYYRIYESGATPGDFSTLDLPYFTGDSNPNNEWQSSLSIDLLSGVTSVGGYEVEIYFEADGNYNGGTFKVYENNGGANFKANFTVTALTPVELSTFTATKEENAVALNWTTLSEENNAGFDIEKSTNGKDFEVIGHVEGAGNSIEKIDYNFMDENPANGINYYRLKQTDFDGAFEYSKIVSVEFESQVQAIVFPNPMIDNLTIRADTQDKVNIRIFNLFGQIVYQNTQRIDNQMDIDLSMLPAGSYFLQVISDTTQDIIFNSNFVKE
jgi:hypothetical protein